MGKVYRRKRHSCGLCKPNKVAGAPARTDRERMEEREARVVIRQAMHRLRTAPTKANGGESDP